MAPEKFNEFEIAFVSKDGVDSPIIDYLLDLKKINTLLFEKSLTLLSELPRLHENGINIEPFKQGKFHCYELRVKSGTNICRFFYTIKKPNFIIIHGFTKKTNKTDSRDIARGEQNLQMYNSLKKTVAFSIS